MNEVFLDTETTGLSFRDGHKIVEIACVETKDLIATGKVFHKLINPKRSVPEEAYNIHGFSEKFLSEKDTFDKVADELLNFIKDKKIIIHNAAFDVGFLNYELKLLKKDEIKKEQVIDSLEIARGKYPGSQNSLDALCKKFNIDLSKRTKHNALLDCELLREVYINLTDQKEPSLIFNEITNNFHRKDNLKKIKKNYSKLIVSPSEVEKERHKKFLKTEIKKNFF